MQQRELQVLRMVAYRTSYLRGGARRRLRLHSGRGQGKKSLACQAGSLQDLLQGMPKLTSMSCRPKQHAKSLIMTCCWRTCEVRSQMETRDF
mmetsp:Transcript_136778/g.354750  ORF Transcript_136778/g.354750 Transcript_136778/m.354750 type:complete len:92 (-) Transcript_136778:191-466(-)